MNDQPTLASLPGRFADLAALLTLVGDHDHETLDFERQFRKSDQRHLAAMTMTAGGVIVVGVDDDHQLVGCPLTEEMRDLVAGLGQDIGLAVTMREVRVGESLARFVRERSALPAEEAALPTFDSDDFGLAAVNAVLERAGRDPVASHDELVGALVDLGLAERVSSDPRGLVVHLAALIAFGRDPTRRLPGARVQFVRRRGRQGVEMPVSRRESFTGPVVEVIEQVIRASLDELPRLETLTGLRRSETSVLPLTALREAVVNAVAHRDYGLPNATVDVTVTDDGFTVQSPGPLPGHVTIENIRGEHYSRNPSTSPPTRV